MKPDGQPLPSGPHRESARRYDQAARISAATVIKQYSTSFGLASALLGCEVRADIRCLYALVRVADEIVDGATAGSGVPVETAGELLDDLEQETLAAIDRGFSSNLVVHAFALTARRVGIDGALVRPFFASMRTDLPTDSRPGDLPHTLTGGHDDALTREAFETYVYGSAEVVGLMCLKAFLADEAVTVEQRERFEQGARRLGAAFQKVNFLRDLAQDHGQLGRSYLPGVDPSAVSESVKREFLDEIDADLGAARTVIDQLPAHSRTAVLVAHDLFAELSTRLRRTPAAELMTHRVRVPDARKVVVIARAIAASGAPNTLGAGLRHVGRRVPSRPGAAT